MRGAGRGTSGADGQNGPDRGAGLPVPRGRIDVTAPIRRKSRRPLPGFTGLPQPAGDNHPGFNDFLPDALRIVYTPPSPVRRTLAYALCGIITVAVLWSVFGTLRLFAIAPGELQARGGNQLVESLERGQVSAISVKNGSHVERNDIVVQLDPTIAKAGRAIVEAKLANARGEAVRGTAAASLAQAARINKDAPVDWPSGIPDEVKARQETVLHADLAQLVASIADLEAKLKTEEASRDRYAANIVAQKTLIDSRTKRIAMRETLAQQGWYSRALVLQALEPLRKDQVTLVDMQGAFDEANAAIPVIRDQIAQARAGFVATNVDAAASASRQVASLVEELKQADVALANLGLRAPATGVVQSLAVTNIGQSVKVGEKLMNIVPDNAPLEIRAYVLNSDIGFVAAGQPVVIKVDTFPYTRYGTIAGRVARVGADAVTGQYALAQQKDDATTPTKGPLSVTNAAQQTSDLVFPVTVIPDKSSINVDGRDVPLTAGMSVNVEIETQRQRVLTYILYPLTRVFAAAPAPG